MPTRSHVCELELSVSPERVFAMLHTPSAIRGWWGAARAIVLPRVSGTWAAVWGEHEDDPDFISFARLAIFEPPRRLAFADMQYHARAGPLPFDSSALRTEFEVEPRPGGALLRVTQSGFPEGPEDDAFYKACEKGWSDTFAGIQRYLGA